MARHTTIVCEMCGAARQDPGERPPTWWLLEDHGNVARTGPLDFCSLGCLQVWLKDTRLPAIYLPDFEGGEVAVWERVAKSTHREDPVAAS